MPDDNNPKYVRTTDAARYHLERVAGRMGWSLGDTVERALRLADQTGDAQLLAVMRDAPASDAPGTDAPAQSDAT